MVIASAFWWLEDVSSIQILNSIQINSCGSSVLAGAGRAAELRMVVQAAGKVIVQLRAHKVSAALNIEFCSDPPNRDIY